MGSSHSKIACGCRYLHNGRYEKEYSIPSCESEVTIERTEREICKIRARQLVAKSKGYLKARGLKRGSRSICSPQKVFQDERPMKSIKNFLEMGTVEAIFDRLLDIAEDEEKDHSLLEEKDPGTTDVKDNTCLGANKVDSLSVSTNIAQKGVVDCKRPTRKLERTQDVKIFVGNIISKALQVFSDAEKITSEPEENQAEKSIAAKETSNVVVLPLDTKVEGTAANDTFNAVKGTVTKEASNAVDVLPLDTEVEEEDATAEIFSEAKQQPMGKEAHNTLEGTAANDTFNAVKGTVTKEASNAVDVLPLDTEVEEEEATAEIFSEAKQQLIDKETHNTLEKNSIKECVNDIIAKVISVSQKDADEHVTAKQHLVNLANEQEEARTEPSFEADNYPLNVEVAEVKSSHNNAFDAEQHLLLPCKDNCKEVTRNLDRNKICVDVIASGVNIAQNEIQTLRETEFCQLNAAEKDVKNTEAFDVQYPLPLDTKVEKEDGIQEKTSEGKKLSSDSSSEVRDSTVDRKAIKNCIDDIITIIAQDYKQTPSGTGVYGMHTTDVEATTIEAPDAHCLLSLDTEVKKKEDVAEKPSEGEEFSFNSSDKVRDSRVNMNAEEATSKTPFEADWQPLNLKDEVEKLPLDFSCDATVSTSHMKAVKGYIDSIFASALNIIQKDEQRPSPSETKYFEMNTRVDDVTATEASGALRVLPLDTMVEKEEAEVEGASEELSLDSSRKERDIPVDMDATTDGTIGSALTVVQDGRAIFNGSLFNSFDSEVEMFVENIIANAVKAVSDELAAVQKKKIDETTYADEVTDHENVGHCPFFGKNRKDSVTELTTSANTGMCNTPCSKHEKLCSLVIKDKDKDFTLVKDDPFKIIIVDETVFTVMEDIVSRVETKEHSSLVQEDREVTDTAKEVATKCEDLFARLCRHDVKITVDEVTISNADIPRQKEARTLNPPKNDAKFGSAYKETTADTVLVEKKKDAVAMEAPCAMAVLEKVVSMATAFELKQVTDNGDKINHQTTGKRAVAADYRDEANREDTAPSYSQVSRSLTERSNFVGNTEPLLSLLGCDVSDNDVAEQIPRISLDGNSDPFLPGKSLSLKCDTVEWLIKEIPDEQIAGKGNACAETLDDQPNVVMGVDEDDLPSIISNEDAEECLQVVNTRRDHSTLPSKNDTISTSSGVLSEERHSEAETNLSSLPFVQSTLKAKFDIAVDNDVPCDPDDAPSVVRSHDKVDRTGASAHDEDPKKYKESSQETETYTRQNEISYSTSDNYQPLPLEKRTRTKLEVDDDDGPFDPESIPPTSQKSSWIGALSSVIPFSFGLNDQENIPEESASVTIGKQEESQLRPSESFATKVSRWFVGDDEQDIHDQAIEKNTFDSDDDDRDNDDDDGTNLEEKASPTDFSKSLQPAEIDETLYELEKAQEKRKTNRLQDEYDIQDVIIAMEEFNKSKTLELFPPGLVSMAFVGTFLKARDFAIDEAIELYANYLVCRKAYSMAHVTPFRNPLLAELYSGRFTVLDARDQDGAAIAIFSAHLQSLEINYSIIMNSIYLQLDEAMKSPETQEHGIVLLYDLSSTNYKTCDVQLCSKIIELLKTAYPVRLRRTLLLSPPFCFEIRLFSTAVFRDPKVRENIHSVTQVNLTQYLPVTCIPPNLGGKCDVNPWSLLEQCMLSYNMREESLVDCQAGRMSHSAENGDDTDVKGQSWISLEEMPKSERESSYLSPNKTYPCDTLNDGFDTKSAVRASDEEKGTKDSSEHCKDIRPAHIREQKNSNGMALVKIERTSSEKMVNGYAWEREMRRIENISGHTMHLNVKSCSSEVNIKYSWQKDERIDSNLNDGEHGHSVADVSTCSPERSLTGIVLRQNQRKISYEKNPGERQYRLDRATECPSQANTSDSRGKHKNVESRKQRIGEGNSYEDAIAVGPNSSSVLGNTERDVLGRNLIDHYRYPDRVIPDVLPLERGIQTHRVAQEMNKYRDLDQKHYKYGSEEKAVPTGLQEKMYEEEGENHQIHCAFDGHVKDSSSYSLERVIDAKINEPEEDDHEDESFIPRVLADPIAAVYNFFKF